MTAAVFPMLDHHIYVEVIWYVAYDDADMIGMVFRESKTAPWQLWYRFRHYVDDKVWDSADTKNVYHIQAPADWVYPRDRLVTTMDEVIDSGTVVAGKPLIRKRITVKGDGEKAGELLMKQPFVHTKSAGVGSSRVQ